MRTTETAQGRVLYDGECPLCTGAAVRFAPMLRRHRFVLVPLQTPWVRKQLGLKPDAALAEMKLLTEGGEIYGGAEALVQIARRIWWAWPVYAISLVPGVKFLLRAIYEWIATCRNCLNGMCAVK